MTPRLGFSLLEGRYTLAQLPPSSPRPDWARGHFTAVIESSEGTSVVCAESALPSDVKSRGGFRCIEIGGSFDLESVGIVAAAVSPLSAAGISVFVYSTWQTDYLLVQECDISKVSMALKEAGHSFR